MHTFLSRCFWALLLLALQVLVFNHIHLWHVAVPLVYVYLLMMFSKDAPRWQPIVWGFLMGLAVDVFTNTPGVAAGSMTLTGLMQPVLLGLMLPKDTVEDFTPSFRLMGVWTYVRYALLVVLFHHIAFFSLEFFSFFHWQYWLAELLGSWVLTVLVVVVLERLRGSR
ncbi:MAG: rod shape-determining protein MreD [Clostridium sp.]|nr:rod shape-determining protein MreD [Clostridium sp.]